VSAFAFSRRQLADGRVDVLCRPTADADVEPVVLHAAGTPAAPLVRVPSGAGWERLAPAWAADRRAAIVAALRAEALLVAETSDGVFGASTTTIASADGTITVASLVEPDERAAPWEITRLVGADGSLLAELRLHAVSGVPRFGAGSVELDLRGRYGDAHRLRVDAGAGVFSLDDGPAETLDRLAARLDPPRPPAAASTRPPSSRELASEMFMGIVGALFAVAGLWVAIAASEGKDRFAGLAGFALGAWAVREARSVWRRRER
jgi:hypothetical protein